MNPRTTRSQAESLLSGGSHKKLRRLPHIFSRVLELPFRSDADVAVEESPDCFKFVAETDGRIGDVVRAHTVEIHPGVTKIVIRSNSLVDFSLLDDLELDMWRFRLPETTRPELASAVYEDGELIVTVPKGGEVENLEEGGGGGEAEGNGEIRGGWLGCILFSEVKKRSRILKWNLTLTGLNMCLIEGGFFSISHPIIV
ncbi:hypothetical protein SCA6_016232 [Theobroma cacao]